MILCKYAFIKKLVKERGKRREGWRDELNGVTDGTEGRTGRNDGQNGGTDGMEGRTDRRDRRDATSSRDVED